MLQVQSNAAIAGSLRNVPQDSVSGDRCSGRQDARVLGKQNARVFRYVLAFWFSACILAESTDYGEWFRKESPCSQTPNAASSQKEAVGFSGVNLGALTGTTVREVKDPKY